MIQKIDQFKAMLSDICTAYFFSEVSPEVIDSYPVMKKVWELTQEFVDRHHKIASKEQQSFAVRQIRDMLYFYYIETSNNKPAEQLSEMFSSIKNALQTKLKITLTFEEESFLKKNEYNGRQSNIKGPHEISEVKIYEILSKHQISGFSPTSQETITKKINDTLKNLNENPRKELITNIENKTGFTIAVLLNLRPNQEDDDLLIKIGELVAIASERGLIRY